MKKNSKTFLKIIGILLLIAIVALVYLNFVYLPQLVKTEGAAYLQQKSKGQIQAESIRYIPFRGAELKTIAIVSRTRKPLFTLDKIYLNVSPWPLIIRQQLDFRIDLYPVKTKRPLVINGLYQIKQQKLTVDSKIRTDLFAQRQLIHARAQALIDRKEKSKIDLEVSSRDLNVQGNFYIKGKDLRIEKFSANILDSRFDLIGDVQNLPNPILSIYGNLDLNLARLKDLNPRYSGMLNKLDIAGRCPGEILIASELNNPQIGLKISGQEIRVEQMKMEDLSLIAKVEDKKLDLNKFYGRLCGGEINLQGDCRLDTQDLPANLNLNIFNLDINRVIKDATGKDSPVHGRAFSLGRLSAPLKNAQTVEGQLWVSVSGSNILQIPFFMGIAEVLRLPELKKVKFKEASGNFAIAGEAIRTDDFNIASNNINIGFKGYMDFAGNLGFDVYPSFSANFLSAAPNISNILGVFIDSTGNFLGEIKLKGNINNPRYSFKPISTDKLFRKGIEEGLKQLFKLKKEE